jgi:hypothetical protein
MAKKLAPSAIPNEAPVTTPIKAVIALKTRVIDNRI